MSRTRIALHDQPFEALSRAEVFTRLSTYPHIVHCPQCNGKIRVPAIAEARQLRCGHCQHSFRLEPEDVIIDVFPDLKDKDPSYWEIVRCGGCNGRLRVPVAEAERRVRCGHCDASLVLAPDEAQQTPAPAAAPTPEVTSEPYSKPDSEPDSESMQETSPPPEYEYTSTSSSAASARESTTGRAIWEALIRWPLSLVFALLSFYLLAPYGDDHLWPLVAAHTAVATVLGTAVVWVLSRRFFIIGDEVIGRALLFLTFLFVAHLGGTGWVFIQPVQPLVAAQMVPVLSLQNTVLGTSVSAATGPRSDQVNLFEGIAQTIRGWGYSWSQDSSWDSEPMTGDRMRSHLKNSYVSPVYRNGRVQAEVTITNSSNQILRGVDAEVTFATSGRTLGTLRFVSDVPLLPGNEAKMYAPLTAEQARKEIIWNNQSVDWRNRESVYFTIGRFDAQPFNRVNHFERNVDRWLAE